MITLALVSSSAFPCDKMDYAEMKDSSVKDLTKYYCMVSMEYDHWRNADAKNKPDLLIEYLTKADVCSTEMQRIKKVLEGKSADVSALRC